VRSSFSLTDFLRPRLYTVALLPPPLKCRKPHGACWARGQAASKEGSPPATPVLTHANEAFTRVRSGETMPPLGSQVVGRLNADVEC
jgi:hypothetical protein